VILLYAREYDKALEQCRKTLEIEPGFGAMFTYIAQIYELQQKYPEATAELEKAHASAPKDVEITYALGQAYALSGKKDEALEISNELNQPGKQNVYLPKRGSLPACAAREKEQALRSCKRLLRTTICPSRNLRWIRASMSCVKTRA